ncbi:MAG: hypothetical protein R6U51_02750 [Anaerolineales bacterium]
MGALLVFRGYPDIIERIMKEFYYISNLLGPEISLRMGDEGALCPHSKIRSKRLPSKKKEGGGLGDKISSNMISNESAH